MHRIFAPNSSLMPRLVGEFREFDGGRAAVRHDGALHGIGKPLQTEIFQISAERPAQSCTHGGGATALQSVLFLMSIAMQCGESLPSRPHPFLLTPRPNSASETYT